MNVTNAMDVSDNAVDASVWGQTLPLDTRLNFLNTEFRQAFQRSVVQFHFTLYSLLCRRVVEMKTRSSFNYAVIDAPYDITLWCNMWYVTEPTYNRVSVFSQDFKSLLGPFDWYLCLI